MDSSIATTRLRLNLLTRATRGSPEFSWLHELLSNEKTTWWSISGQSKSLEDTDQKTERYLPPDAEGEEKQYRVAYMVHAWSANDTPKSDLSHQDQTNSSTEFIGLVNVTSIGRNHLPLPEHLTLPASAAATTLTVEVAYQFLPKAWGMGYATEAVNAVLNACRDSTSFWSPFPKLYVRAIVNLMNPSSMRVMEKVGMSKKGIFEWTGKAIFLAGQWREKDTLVIYGKHLIE